MDQRELKTQFAKEILQSTAVPIVSIAAFLYWAYHIIQFPSPSILIFPLSALILIPLYLLSGMVYSGILIGLLTIVGFLCIMLTRVVWAPLIYFLEISWLWGVLMVVRGYRETHIRRQNIMREKEETLDTKIMLLDGEMQDMQKRQENLKRRIEDYRSLGQIVKVFSSTLEEDKIGPLITGTSAKFIGRGTWKMRKGLQGDIFAQYIRKHRVPLIIRDLRKDDRFLVDKPKFASLIAIPLESDNEFWGALEGISPRQNEFDESDLRLLSLLGSIASLAVNNIHLYKRTRELAITDGLTGLYVQSYFKERLAEEVMRSKRHKLQLTVAILDIDHFKDFNDTYGHIAGDAILRQLADLLRRRLRETDFVCRYGGEEFAVFMMQTEVREAYKVCEDIRLGIETERFYLPVESFKPVQVKVYASIGISKLSNEVKTEKELLKIADAALYRAKTNGRNRVEIGY